VTTNRKGELDELSSSLADIVCWMTFYLQRCSPDELDLDVASALLELITGSLRDLPPTDRLTFLQHAANRAHDLDEPVYQDFLLDLAETMGLE
jgi:hypothetical protein